MEWGGKVPLLIRKPSYAYLPQGNQCFSAALLISCLHHCLTDHKFRFFGVRFLHCFLFQAQVPAPWNWNSILLMSLTYHVRKTIKVWQSITSRLQRKRLIQHHCHLSDIDFDWRKVVCCSINQLQSSFRRCFSCFNCLTLYWNEESIRVTRVRRCIQIRGIVNLVSFSL